MVCELGELSPMLQTVIVANNCHFPHRSVAFLAGQNCEIFSSSVNLVSHTLPAVFIQNWIIRQIIRLRRHVPAGFTPYILAIQSKETSKIIFDFHAMFSRKE